MIVSQTECPLTFEDSTKRFVELSESYGHLDPVKLYYFKGDFILTYSKEYDIEQSTHCQVCDCD